MPGTILLAPLPGFPNEMTSFVANIRPTMALQDLRGGTVEPDGPMEPSTHWTCGSYEARATPKLLSPPGNSGVSVLLSFLFQAFFFDYDLDLFIQCTHLCRLQVHPYLLLLRRRRSLIRRRRLGIHQVR